eukprot:m.152953 g.152953  ORF g.152953 m.152953 type:complete len:54 (+) comp30819_c0_seq1:1854-2015(+)
MRDTIGKQRVAKRLRVNSKIKNQRDTSNGPIYNLGRHYEMEDFGSNLLTGVKQ